MIPLRTSTSMVGRRFQCWAHHSCCQRTVRNTRAIAKTAGRHISIADTLRTPNAPVGVDTEVVRQDDHNEIKKLLNGWVKNLDQSGRGQAIPDCGSLSIYKTVLVHEISRPFIESYSDRRPGRMEKRSGILYSTIRSFKGTRGGYRRDGRCDDARSQRSLFCGRFLRRQLSS